MRVANRHPRARLLNYTHSIFALRLYRTFNCEQAEAQRFGATHFTKSGFSERKFVRHEIVWYSVRVCLCDPATKTKTNADTRANQSHRKMWNEKR